MTKISIIIPNYNNSYWLKSCIESCIDQTGPFKKEIIVVDDHSTDQSLKVLKDIQNDFPEEVLVYTNSSKGANSARNFGFKQSTGSFIQWLDSDDTLLKGKLEEQLQYLSENPTADIVYSDWRKDTYDDNNHLIDSEILKRKKCKDFLKVLLQNIYWNVPNTYLMRREICQKTIDSNGWNEETKVGQDREFFTLAGILGAKYSYVPGLFSTYNRWSNETISTKYKEKEITKESIKLNDRFYKAIENSNHISKKGAYFKILNSELLNAIYHHPELHIPRKMLPWRFSVLSLHWKLRLISPFLYLYHIVKAKDV